MTTLDSKMSSSSSILQDLLRDHSSEIGNWSEMVSNHQDESSKAESSSVTIDYDGPFYIFVPNLSLESDFDSASMDVFKFFGGHKNLFAIYGYSSNRRWKKAPQPYMLMARNFESCIQILMMDEKVFANTKVNVEYVLLSTDPPKTFHFSNAELQSQLDCYRSKHPVEEKHKTDPFCGAKPIDTSVKLLSTEKKLREEKQQQQQDQAVQQPKQQPPPPLQQQQQPKHHEETTPNGSIEHVVKATFRHGNVKPTKESFEKMPNAGFEKQNHRLRKQPSASSSSSSSQPKPPKVLHRPVPSLPSHSTSTTTTMATASAIDVSAGTELQDVDMAETTDPVQATRGTEIVDSSKENQKQPIQATPTTAVPAAVAMSSEKVVSPSPVAAAANNNKKQKTNKKKKSSKNLLAGNNRFSSLAQMKNDYAD